MMRVLALAWLIFCLNGIAAAAGPLGLEWGMTPSQVEALGVVLRPIGAFEGTKGFKTSRLPADLEIDCEYTLMFSPTHQLQRIDTFWLLEDDGTGTNGKAAFDIARSALQKKFGSPTLIEQSVKRSRFKDNEFYECLQTNDCKYFANFQEQKSRTQAHLILFGKKHGMGQLTVFISGPEVESVR